MTPSLVKFAALAVVALMVISSLIGADTRDPSTSFAVGKVAASPPAVFSLQASSGESMGQKSPCFGESERSAGISIGVVTSAAFVVGATIAVAQRTLTRSSLRAAASQEYWQGEWICADCGYIYNERAFGSKFEDLGQGAKCPQCAAPRRRFARKLGDKIGTTLDGGDGPILIFTGVCLVAVFAIAYFALQ